MIGHSKRLVGAWRIRIGLADFDDMAEVAHQLHQARAIAADVVNVVEQQLDAMPAAGHTQGA